MAKLNLILLVVCAASIATVVYGATMEDYIEKKQQIRQSCQAKTKVSMELIDGLSAGNFPEGNQDLKCFIGCCLDLMQSMKDGKFDKATALSMIDAVMPENLRDAAKKACNACGGKFDSLPDPCDMAWETIKCWKTEDPSFKFY